MARGINIGGIGGDDKGTGAYRGAYWERLTSTTIDLRRFSEDSLAGEIRVRIWVYD